MEKIVELLNILIPIGGLFIAIIGWIIKQEVRINKLDDKIDFNSERDKTRNDAISEFIREVREELKSIHSELRTINDYITTEKALKSQNG